jgi:NCS1 family nucleobase:cation symporter-1
MMPWKLLGDFSATFSAGWWDTRACSGPSPGVMIADYFVVRHTRAQTWTTCIFAAASTNIRDGINWRAVVRWPRGSPWRLLGLAVPPLRWLYDYAWFVGFGVSGAVYLLMGGKR